MLKPAKRLLLPLAALTLVLVCLAAPAGAATPPANIPPGREPSSCSTEASTECERWAIGRLDAARADIGLAAYALPADFSGLSADRQLLILTDLDRTAYGYTPVYGLNTDLSEAAYAGVREGRDPNTPAAGGPWKGFGSNWASTSALIGYYLWMYDDGYGGPNRDCTSPDAAGCWGHRKVILGDAVTLPQPQLMGGATGNAARNAGTALIISSNDTTNTYYTWAQAQLEGAGGNSGEPPVVPNPPESPAGEKPTAPSPPPPSRTGTQPRSEVLASTGDPTALIAVLLGDHLSPAGRAARIPAILKHGGITLALPRGLRGRLVVDYYLDSRRRLLVAKGTRHLSGSGEAVAVTLTTAGQYVLRHRVRVALTVYARLVLAKRPAITVSEPLVLTR